MDAVQDETTTPSFNKLPNLEKEPRLHVRVVSNAAVAGDVILLTLARPQEFTFVPGQYVWLVLPDRAKKQRIIDRRAYSISSGTNNENVELLIRLTGSDYLKDVAKLTAGDAVDIIGPMGSAFIAPEQGAVLIAGGTGAAPFLSILRSGANGTFSFISYESKERPLYCKAELEEHARQHREDTVRCKEDSPQQSDFDDIVNKNDSRQIFIAGPQGFVDTVTEILLKLGVSSGRMRYEALYPLLGASRELVGSLEKLVAQSYDIISKPIPEISQLGDLFLMAVRQTTNHVTITDPNGRILFANKAAEDTTGYTLEEMRGQTSRLWGGLMPPLLYRTLWGKKDVPGQKSFYAVLNRRRDGLLYVARARISPILVKESLVAYVATEEDITDLVELDKAKSDFISIASHQLRTPITGVQWAVERLEKMEKMSAKGREYMQDIRASTKGLAELVDNLLNVTRLEGGDVAVISEKFDFIRSIKNVIADMRMLRDKKNIKQKFVSQHKKLEMVSDKNIVRNIIQSFISNAVEYTPDGGSVEVAVEQHDKNAVFIVHDTGIGISKEDQQKLFTKFYRAENAKRARSGGTGLGLYIAKNGIDLLGGKVTADSEEGRGTTFRVELPTEVQTRAGDKQLR
ncbi:MAG: PAS/PAC sensor hybrid histidine kinase [Candidatus Kaiserbacteria bacterium GW2011_GWC2_52_8b]|uniref:histidine kinase n=3 Tax=Candidatus Kaiseribacteriota TaxID=1752734 RepID=A0A0G1XKN3_9BACT|nr:MAG: PAS/PAC sensor hybrid histidine kinase [Candidatus Kaiserbacteria bacterium GW2011_GWA2_52_12]KKW31476.1 MAG: PAS/PAC sensor hybrid histidine kinase [Candidatus Kaiserbacteria bacterium GW2011_GWC2_52_8b]